MTFKEQLVEEARIARLTCSAPVPIGPELDRVAYEEVVDAYKFGLRGEELLDEVKPISPKFVQAVIDDFTKEYVI